MPNTKPTPAQVRYLVRARKYELKYGLATSFDIPMNGYKTNYDCLCNGWVTGAGSVSWAALTPAGRAIADEAMGKGATNGTC